MNPVYIEIITKSASKVTTVLATEIQEYDYATLKHKLLTWMRMNWDYVAGMIISNKSVDKVQLRLTIDGYGMVCDIPEKYYSKKKDIGKGFLSALHKMSGTVSMYECEIKINDDTATDINLPSALMFITRFADENTNWQKFICNGVSSGTIDFIRLTDKTKTKQVIESWMQFIENNKIERHIKLSFNKHIPLSDYTEIIKYCKSMNFVYPLSFLIVEYPNKYSVQDFEWMIKRVIGDDFNAGCATLRVEDLVCLSSSPSTTNIMFNKILSSVKDSVLVEFISSTGFDKLDDKVSSRYKYLVEHPGI